MCTSLISFFFFFPAPRSYKGGEEETTTDINVDEIIASVLADNPSVTEVNLNNVSKVTSENLDQLIEALVTNTHISKLQLANTRLKDSHALVSRVCGSRAGGRGRGIGGKVRVWEQGWWEGKGYWWEGEGVGAGLVGGEGVLVGR